MCCEPPGDLPAAVAEMLVRYQEFATDPSLYWDGETNESTILMRSLRFASFPELLQAARVLKPEAAESAEMLGDLAGQLNMGDAAVLRQCLADRVPHGLVALRIKPHGLVTESAPQRPVLPGESVILELLLDSSVDRQTRVRTQGADFLLQRRGAELVQVSVSHDSPEVEIKVGQETVRLTGLVAPLAAATLRVKAPVCARWSVVDETGWAWFPDDALRKWDFSGRSFFHETEALLQVPAGTLHVQVTRGNEYTVREFTVAAPAGEETLVRWEPERWCDPNAEDWYSADLHVHMNITGDLVCTPQQAVRMQHGEGLNLMNLVAANLTQSRVFDKEALEEWPGVDLPWSTEGGIARMGVEYRNDLLGHVHVLGLAQPPAVYHTGHPGTDHDEDWPPNAVACRNFRNEGGTVGYCHPVFVPVSDDDDSERAPSEVFARRSRTVEARELVVDAALGVVDSVDVLSNADPFASSALYRRLLGAGIRLAVSAGTDTFLSYSRNDVYSNPPGWARMYAHIPGEPLTVASYQRAVRRGATIASTGPWLELHVEGRLPGSILDVAAGEECEIVARVRGADVERLELRTADGLLAACDVSAGQEEEIRISVRVAEATWVVATAHGRSSNTSPAPVVFSHTSPVYLDVDGRRATRTRHVNWCLSWLDHLEWLVRTHGVYHHLAHLDDMMSNIDRAREIYRSGVV